MIEDLLEPLICERFRNDARYREGHLRIINALPQRRVLGLHSPEVKKTAKQLSHKGREVIDAFERVPNRELYYEETVVWGYLINLEKCTLAERLTMLERYVPVLDNWAVCDSYCAHAKWMLRADKEILWEFLQRWFDSERELEVRFALVTAMCYFLNEEWLDRVFQRIDNLEISRIKSEYKTIKGKPIMAQLGTVQGVEPYYVRMGIAWLLATALAKFPERTRAYIRASHLPVDIIKLYIRKARESFKTRTVEAM